MKLHLTTAEMLDEWMARRLASGFRRDCHIEPTGIFATDEYELKELISWYAELLATASPEYLAPVDLAREAQISILPGRVALVTLPDNVVRVVGITCPGWERPAEIVADLESAVAVDQRNPFTHGGPAHPVALVVGPHQLRVYSLPTANPEEPIFSSILCVVNPDQGFFDLDSRALSLISLIK